MKGYSYLLYFKGIRYNNSMLPALLVGNIIDIRSSHTNLLDTLRSTNSTNAHPGKDINPRLP